MKKTLIFISSIIYVIIITLLIITAILLINGKLLYGWMATKWLPPLFIADDANKSVTGIETEVIEVKYKTFKFKYYIIKCTEKKNLIPIIWFTGEYFEPIKIQRYFFENLSLNTGRTVCVFEYPNYEKCYLYEVMGFIINLLHSRIFSALNINMDLFHPKHEYENKDKFILAGNNSGCFYAMLYVDYLVNTLKQFIIYDCVFFDGIYNILSIPSPYYRWLWKNRILDDINICKNISENCSMDMPNQSPKVSLCPSVEPNSNESQQYQNNSAQCKLCLRVYQSLQQKRIMPVDIHVITSSDKFYHDMNESFVNEDTHHRELIELPENSVDLPYFYYYETMQSIIAKCFHEN